MDFLNLTYPFSLIPLPYAYDALEPVIDAKTMYFHHDKHLKTYVDNLNKALAQYPEYQCWSLKELLQKYYLLPSPIQTEIINNAGGVYNHNLYFYSMIPKSESTSFEEVANHFLASPCFPPKPNIFTAILRSYTSFYTFKDCLIDAAVKQFGSGYAWLVLTPTNDLAIISTPNQQTPLPHCMTPLLLVDVWEHAYYLKYQNARKTYLENWFCLINWPLINERYLSH